MVLKGVVSSIETTGARIAFPDRNNIVSAPLPSGSNVGALAVGDTVVVVFFADNMQDGLVLAKF